MVDFNTVYNVNVCTQLTDEERVYLNAAAMGNVPIIRLSLDDDSKLNINCVDYMGRSALHLAVDSENLEAIELLLDRINFHSIEEALLHAISKVCPTVVKLRSTKCSGSLFSGETAT